MPPHIKDHGTCTIMSLEVGSSSTGGTVGSALGPAVPQEGRLAVL